MSVVLKFGPTWSGGRRGARFTPAEVMMRRKLDFLQPFLNHRILIGIPIPRDENR